MYPNDADIQMMEANARAARIASITRGPALSPQDAAKLIGWLVDEIRRGFTLDRGAAEMLCDLAEDNGLTMTDDQYEAILGAAWEAVGNDDRS